MKYFAYGMNTNLAEMERRCPTAVCLGAAWINDYEFVFRTHADIAESAGSLCYGVLWDITKADLRALDMLEGYPYYYNRFRVRVNLGDHFVYALTYQMNDQTYMQEPGQGYLETVTDGYRQNGVPTGQIGHAINMVCSTSNMTNAECPYTWSPTIKDFA
jgi:gamma-glutamylcyclotransferase (GGCT)/AIG2-like uncharacterized protein YtfP